MCYNAPGVANTADDEGCHYRPLIPIPDKGAVVTGKGKYRNANSVRQVENREFRIALV